VIHLAVRGYVDGKQQFEDLITIFDPDAIEHGLDKIAEKHAAVLASHTLHMIEIEFLDEPDAQHRFFRFGTDPSGMMIPIRLDRRANTEGDE
jgi:hypothetical protein